MGKVKKPIECFHTPKESTPPESNQSPSSRCKSGGIAMVRYNQIKEFKNVSKRQKNCNSARLPRMKTEEKLSDLLATNIALTGKKEELTKDLEEVNVANGAAKEKLSAKVQEILNATFI